MFRSEGSGRSSGVEHNLAKVRVGRSNRLARSKYKEQKQVAFGRPFLLPCSQITGQTARVSRDRLDRPDGHIFGLKWRAQTAIIKVGLCALATTVESFQSCQFGAARECSFRR